MFDPGAMGTLLIGLNAEREEVFGDRKRRPEVTGGREHPRIRVALANSLRRAATLLDQPRVGETASSGRS